MKTLYAVLTVMLVLLAAMAHAQDNIDVPGGIKNADLFTTNNYSIPYIFTSGGVVGRQVDISPYQRSGGHYEVQTVFDSEGNIYFRGSIRGDETPNNSVRIYSLTPTGGLRWRSDNLFGAWAGAPPIVGVNAVYGIGREFGKAGAGSAPVVAALNKATGATLWTTVLPEGVPGFAATLYNGVLYVSTDDYLRPVGEEDIPTVTIYAINAANGSILRRYDVTVSQGGWTAKPVGPFTLVPNVFGAGQHGLYFNVDRNPRMATAPNVFGINLATGTVWSTSGGKAFRNHLIYSPVTNELILTSWSDYGQTISTYDPVTGAKKHESNWRNVSVLDPLQSRESATSWLWSTIGGHGYADTAALLPDGTSVITAGFNGIVTLYTRDDTGAYSGRILAHGSAYWGEFQNMAQVVGMVPNGSAPGGVWVSATRSERSETGQTCMVVAVDAITGAVLWQYDTGRGSHADLRGGAVVGPNGYIYYMTPENILHILSPAPAPQIDLTVELPGYAGPINTGSGDGMTTVAPPLTLEFRTPGTQTVRFYKTVALTVSDGEAYVRLNNIPPGTYDISAKGYLQFFPWEGGRTFWFTRTIRALAPSVVVPPNGTGSVAVTLTLFAGDADDDNEITLFDFGRLVSAFGSLRGDGNWSQRVDFDGDEEVTLFDFGILVRNFGMIGED